MVLIAGPPLPGRWLLTRALVDELGARRLSLHAAANELEAEVRAALPTGGALVIDGELCRRSEREAALRAVEGAERLLVEWRCAREQAEQQFRKRWAGQPEALEACERERYLADLALREPVGSDEAERVVTIPGERPLEEQLAALRPLLPSERPVDPPAPRPSVLLVEDDPDERALLADVLAELGWAVELAPDAAVALALLRDGPPVELLLSDQRLPGLSGVELLQLAAREHPELRAVLLTAYADEPTCSAALRAHAQTVLAKPVHLLDLQRVLDS